MGSYHKVIISRILSDANLQTYWLDQQVNNENLFLRTMKENLYSKYKNNFEEQLALLDSQRKLRTYKQFKKVFCLESYMLTLPSVTYIQSIARFRLSSHNLRIELGRLAKPKLAVSDRLCLQCNSGAVDDELHFLMACPKCHKERKVLSDTAALNITGFSDSNTHDRFLMIMSTKCSAVNFCLGQFLYKCLPR